MRTFDFTRSALFVPGNRPDLIDKAVATQADLIIIDLEDAVPASEKIKARHYAAEKLKLHQNCRLMVRVNALETGLVEDDLACIVESGLTAIMLPKVQTVEDIVHIGKIILSAEKIAGIEPGSVGLALLIETALGVQNTYAIAATRINPPRPCTLAFGAADFCLDMGIQMSKNGEEISFARAQIALGARAADIDKPLDSPFMIDLKDREAFKADVIRGRSLGFGGKLCIHPDQVDYCNHVFSPSEKEIKLATQVVEAFEAAKARGKGAILMDGKFIDSPVVDQYKKMLKPFHDESQNG